MKNNITKTSFNKSSNSKFYTRQPQFDDSFYELVKLEENRETNNIARNQRDFDNSALSKEYLNRSLDDYNRKMGLSGGGFESTVPNMNKIKNSVDTGLMNFIPYARRFDAQNDGIRIRTSNVNRNKVLPHNQVLNRSKRFQSTSRYQQQKSNYQGFLTSDIVKNLNNDYSSSNHFACSMLEQSNPNSSYLRTKIDNYNQNHKTNFKNLNDNMRHQNLQNVSRLPSENNTTYVKFYQNKPKRSLINIDNRHSIDYKQNTDKKQIVEHPRQSSVEYPRAKSRSRSRHSRSPESYSP